MSVSPPDTYFRKGLGLAAEVNRTQPITEVVLSTSFASTTRCSWVT
ncbi:MAG: hypothetical protein U0163_15310 [Gemmatimonadaceae bacterium]